MDSGVADQLGRVAGAAVELLEGRSQAVRGETVDDLAHRGALAGAHVVGVVASWRPSARYVQGGDVGHGQVQDVDVVAHAGAVGGGVVGAEDLGGLAAWRGGRGPWG